MTQEIDYRHNELLQMLPRFYDDAPEVDNIMYADAVEIERIRQEARDLLIQLTASTATWGLSDWERVLELPPRPNSSEEIRRSRILAKLRGTTPATVANMLAIVNAHVPAQNASLIELPEPGVVQFVIPAQPDIDLRTLYEDIHTYKPAHLSLNTSTQSEGGSNVGTANIGGGELNLGPLIMTELKRETSAKLLAGVITTQKITIYPMEKEVNP